MNPGRKEQQEFWNSWVAQSRNWETNADNIRRGLHILKEVVSFKGENLRFIDVGCGNGWLSRKLREFGDVTAVDLASDVLDELRRTDSSINWIGADFLELELPQEHFDVVTCVETISHVNDQRRFVERLAQIMRPGGLLVLTTQNEYVWNRTSWLEPPEKGQIRNWPSRTVLAELFSPYFELKPITTCAPGGNRGLPLLVNNPFSRIIGGVVFGKDRWTEIREGWGFGRSLVVVGRKKS